MFLLFVCLFVRLVFATNGGVPFAISSVLPYVKYEGKLRLVTQCDTLGDD